MLEPWGQDYQRDAIISAQLSALSCSVAVSHGAKQKPIPVQDFMPANWHRPPVQANENSIKAAEKAFAAKWGK